MNTKTEYQLSIITKIRKLREDHNYSQKNIADLLGITYGQMGNIESIKMPTKYTLSHISKICTHFNIPIESIFIDDNDYEKNIEIIKTLINKIILYNER